MSKKVMREQPLMSYLRTNILGTVAVVVALATVAPRPSEAQWTPMKRGSDNIEVLGHLPLGPALNVADMDVEQELSRPYAYVGRMVYGGVGEKGMDIISIEDQGHPELLYEWRIDEPDLHLGLGGMDVKHFKVNGRYYVIQSVQFGQGGPDSDMGGVVLDVTGLPDVSTVREIARIREPLMPGGFHNIFVYRHSDGRVLLFATVSGPFAKCTTWARSFRALLPRRPWPAVCPIPALVRAGATGATTTSTWATIPTLTRIASMVAAVAAITSTTSPTSRSLSY